LRVIARTLNSADQAGSTQRRVESEVRQGDLTMESPQSWSFRVGKLRGRVDLNAIRCDLV